MFEIEKCKASVLVSTVILAASACVNAQGTPNDTRPPASNQPTDSAPKADDPEATADLAALHKQSAVAAGAGGETDANKLAKDPQQAMIAKLRADADLRNEQLSAQLAALRAENDQLKLANDVAQQKQVQSLQTLQAEKGLLEAQLALLNAKDSTAAAPEKAKLDALQRTQQIRSALLTDELAALGGELQRLKQAQEVNEAKLQSELAASRANLERARVTEEELDMASKVKIASVKREQERLAVENALAAEKRRSEQSKITDDQMRAAAIAQTTAAQVTNRDAEDKWRDAVNAPVPYTSEPFKDGVITVSDRKIEMDGPIVTGTADYVCDRIDYFNNQDRTKPIFVVINNSPGGSVMQGYRILKAIETSDAPIHVVVKSFAASMAATIATLAPHSYAYPNAIILHHQMSGGASGNMTDIEQEVKTMQEWERRLAEPIAKKMGISLDQFKAKMYSAKKSGDWDEFADKALELKWVDHLVNEIREEGIRKKPTGTAQPSWMYMMKKDDKGAPYMALPPLEPYDCYFMINPRNFYRIEGR